MDRNALATLIQGCAKASQQAASGRGRLRLL